MILEVGYNSSKVHTMEMVYLNNENVSQVASSWCLGYCRNMKTH